MPTESEHLPGQPVLVLGMHRSGTSCLAGCLQAAGLVSGEVNTRARHNARGNREHMAVMQLNDEVLAANGGSWRSPPDSVAWTPAQIRSARSVAASIAAEGIWGFKDPRTLLTIGGWLEALGEVRLCASFRHPRAVARSLNSRDATLGEAEGLRLWHSYNSRLLELAAARPIAMVDYDQAGEPYLRAVERIAQRLGLPAPEAATRFYDTELRHQTAEADVPLPDDLQLVHSRLRALAAAR